MARGSRVRTFLAAYALIVCFFHSDSVNSVTAQTPNIAGGTPCYDENQKPQRCIPPFENAAFHAIVEASNTCGTKGPTEYCVQTGTHLSKKSCDVCLENTANHHSVTYLTDGNVTTWWQSETMLQDIQHPTQVNITLKFGKTFDITFVRLLFWCPRPESFAIYKKTYEDSHWAPFQFYSGSCRDTYGLPDENSGKMNDSDTRVFCRSEYSDLSPLSGGSVPFATLEGRPRAKTFDTNYQLQEFVTASEIRITLERLNTFGDEVFEDPQVLKSYFYAISEINVGARCKCNGHASECVFLPSVDRSDNRRVCRCEHNTGGPDCGECAPFYNDAPWKRASPHDAHECKPCNCNGFSNRCFFDKDLYNQTGHGGHCLDCRGDRDGPNCEKCRENYYQEAGADYCSPCNCNPTGSRSLQCNSEGKCQCKPGVIGDKCDRCDANYYHFSDPGCTKCDCNPSGSTSNTPACDSDSGICDCKENVEGAQCRSCKPGFFNLDLENEFGCTPCFCYGHSSVCRSAPGYSKVVLESVFARGTERWTAVDYHGNNHTLQYSAYSQALELTAPGSEPLYFSAPERFLGDQRASYNHILSFTLRIAEGAPAASKSDVILEGAGLKIEIAIFYQENEPPSEKAYEYSFRLHENPDHGWQPRLLARDFISVLSNLTSIKIRGTYAPTGTGFLEDFRLETARRGAAGTQANWIEMCTCPPGYVGQFCESCEPGYRHDPTSGGPFAPCVPCNCNGHAKICDADTGRCICQDNTGGDNCERCARGYYGNSLEGTVSDCKQCPCPNQGPCIQLADDNIMCLECPRGYGGLKCDLCSDGYHGDPSEEKLVCQACDCNNNVDLNAVGNCNRTTGECLKCIYNTGGPQCDTCLPGFYGDALALPKGDCKPCQCYPPGTNETESLRPVCDQLSGQCSCKPHVVGINCDRCEHGYFNIRSEVGCESCNCDPIGSLNLTCDADSGQCKCREGVTGKRCELCKPNYYGFSVDGCKPCECDPIGSNSLQCDPFGQCPCLDNVEGRTCDRCKENKHNRQRGCEKCPDCYNLVQDAVNAHRSNLRDLDTVLRSIANSPTVINDQDFEQKLSEVAGRVEKLWADAQQATSGGDKSLSDRLNDLRSRIKAAKELMFESGKWNEAAGLAARDAGLNVTLAENTIQSTLEALQAASDYLKSDGSAALDKAMKKSELFGMQSEIMAKLAKEARQVAADQQKDADKIKEIAVKAVSVSTSAHDLAKEALSTQKNITDDLRILESDLAVTQQNFELILGSASDVKQRVYLAHADSLAVYTDIYALTVPDINTEIIKLESQSIAREAERIRNLSDALLKDHEVELQRLEDLLKSSDELLKVGILQQNIAEELLKDAQGASNKADDAVKMGDKTLKEAQETYTTLKGFDKQVQESKDKASTALETIPVIAALIDDAKAKADVARDNLVGAVTNAQLAKNTAQQAQTEFAEQASKEADAIRKSADETKQEASNLKQETDKLAIKVDETEARIQKLETDVEEGSALTNQAKKKIGQAKTNASEATRQVQKALEEVNKIVKELNDLADIDDESLTNLENRLRYAENEFYEAKLDQELETLTQARIQQSQLVKNYLDELERLEEDVKNIEAIQNSLPDGCFQRNRLEP